MFGLFDSLVDLIEDTATIIVAPVQIAVDITAAAVRPVAELAEDVVTSVKDELR